LSLNLHMKKIDDSETILYDLDLDFGRSLKKKAAETPLNQGFQRFDFCQKLWGNKYSQKYITLYKYKCLSKK